MSVNPYNRLGRAHVIVILILEVRKLGVERLTNIPKITKRGGGSTEVLSHSCNPTHLTPASQKSVFLPFVPSLRKLCRSVVDSYHSFVSKSIHNVQVINRKK